MSKKKIMFISSTGGHLNELLQLSPMFDNYDYQVITEKTKSNEYLKDIYKDRVGYLVYGTKHHLFSYPFKLIYNCFKSSIGFKFISVFDLGTRDKSFIVKGYKVLLIILVSMKHKSI